MPRSQTNPQVMRAAVTISPGAPPALTDVPVPQPGPGEVLVRVMASSVNPTDVMTWQRGAFVTGEKVPFIGGYDIAGVVVEAGRGVTALQPGDHVVGLPCFPHPGQAFAAFTTAPARSVAALPDSARPVAGTRWSELAAMPLAGLTAWQALVDTARLQPGQRVLIHAASGGVGHLAIQLAAHLGAEVTAVTSHRGRALVESLNPTQVIDRATPQWPDRVSPQDVVLDTVGGAVTPLSLSLAGPAGMVIALHPYAHDDLASRDNRLTRMLVEPDHTAMAQLLALNSAGHLRPHVGATYDLANIGEALRHVQHAKTPGKTTITIHRGDHQ